MRETTLSKYLSLGLFVVLPFVGFFAGVCWSFYFDRSGYGSDDVVVPTPSDLALPRHTVKTSQTILPGESWKTFSVHEPGIDGKMDSFTIMVPRDWVARNYPGKGQNGPWSLQSTPFENNLHGTGVPEQGSMWVEIGYCNTMEFVDSGEYVPFADEGDKYPPVVEKIVCKDGYEVRAGLWSDDPDYTKYTHILDAVLTSFNVGKDAVL